MADNKIVYTVEVDTKSMVASIRKANKQLGSLEDQEKKTDQQTKKLTDRLRALGEQARTMGNGLNKAGNAMKTGITQAGKLSTAVLAAGAAVYTLVQNIADATNELVALSERTGVSTKTLAGLRLMANNTGQNLSELSEVLNPMIGRMGQVAQGSKTAKDAFNTLGVEVLDANGNLRSANDVFLEITESLQAIEDPTERAAAATIAFGESGTKLLQTLGDESLSDFVKIAEKYGASTGPEATAASKEWQEAVSGLHLVLSGLFSETGIIETATQKVRELSTGVVYFKVSIQELSQDIIPNLGAAFTLLFATILSKAAEWAVELNNILGNAIDGYVKLYQHIAGTGPVTDALLALTEKSRELAVTTGIAVQNVAEGWRKSAASVDSYRNAVEKAQAEAEEWARYQDRRRESLRSTGDSVTPQFGPTAGGAVGTSTGEGLTGPESIDLSGSGTAAEGGIVTESAALENTISIVDELTASMTDLTDPTGLFRDLLGEISNSMVAISEIDFQNVETSLDGISTIAKSVGNMMGSIIQQQIRDNEELTDKQKKNLKILFTIQKAAAITSIVVDTAQAIMRAYAELGPIGGPIAAAAIGVVGAIQAGIVGAEKPPFHVGGMIPEQPGEVSIRALPGESVLNREATAALGPEGVNAMNSGMGSQPVMVEMVYKHRIFDNFVSDNIKKGGPLSTAIKSGRRVGHRRG